MIATCGGYLRGGMSILVLGMLSMIGMTASHAMNGLKALIGALVNGIAVVAFIVNGGRVVAGGGDARRRHARRLPRCSRGSAHRREARP